MRLSLKEQLALAELAREENVRLRNELLEERKLNNKLRKRLAKYESGWIAERRQPKPRIRDYAP